jgi:aminoglycoside phosphotransferase (APT) family kinase protein
MPPTEVLGLDLSRLDAWLSGHTDVGPIERVEQIAGGRSNLTYRAEVPGATLIIRRPPFGRLLAGAHDVAREHRIVQALHGTGVPVAEPVGLCEDLAVLGVPFSVTRFVDGATLRTPDDAAELLRTASAPIVEPFARTLAQLHRVDPRVTGYPVARGSDHIARQLRVWGRQLTAPPVRDLAVLERVAATLASTQPVQRRTAIVHGDYRLDNVRLGPDGRVRAIIDWELWTLGDPMVDLGIALAYWLDEPWELAPLGSSPTFVPGLGRRDQLLATYLDAAATTLDEPRMWWYAAFATWRFAAILEGVYRRQLSGMYGDPDQDGFDWRRFAYVVPALGEQAAGLLQRGGWPVAA